MRFDETLGSDAWAVQRKLPAVHPRPPALKNGGAEGIRTPDPHNAIVVLYQLSYDPNQSVQVACFQRFPPLLSLAGDAGHVRLLAKKPANRTV